MTIICNIHLPSDQLIHDEAVIKNRFGLIDYEIRFWESDNWGL